MHPSERVLRLGQGGVIITSVMPSVFIGGKQFSWGERTFIMAHVNATPDSFSGDRLNLDVDAAVFLAKKMVLEGADLINVRGGVQPTRRPAGVRSR